MGSFRAEVEWLLQQAATPESRAAFLAREPGPDEAALPGDGYIVRREERRRFTISWLAHYSLSERVTTLNYRTPLQARRYRR